MARYCRTPAQLARELHGAGGVLACGVPTFSWIAEFLQVGCQWPGRRFAKAVRRRLAGNVGDARYGDSPDRLVLFFTMALGWISI